MANDERRAEIAIEALSEIAAGRGKKIAGDVADQMQALAHDALDRVRDAPGEEKCSCGAPTYGASKCWRCGEAARSSQGEDHEAGIEAARNALFDAAFDEVTRDDAEAAIAAYLSRVSSRDARGDDECRVNLVSSRMCERGTKSCEVEHRSPQGEDHETEARAKAPDDPVTP